LVRGELASEAIWAGRRRRRLAGAAGGGRRRHLFWGWLAMVATGGRCWREERPEIGDGGWYQGGQSARELSSDFNPFSVHVKHMSLIICEIFMSVFLTSALGT